MKSFLLPLLAGVTLLCPVVVRAQEALAPSAALRAALRELQTARPQQREIANRHLDRTAKENLPEAERFALAELYFVALKGGDARAAFAPFLAGTDLRARLAWQRLMRMTAVIDGDFPQVARLVQEYRAKFEPDWRDPYHTLVGTQALVGHHAAKAEHDKVVELILAEVHALPPDHPCYAALLIAANVASFQALGRTEEAVRLLREKGVVMENLAQRGYTGWPADEIPRLEENADPRGYFATCLERYRAMKPAPTAKP